ncbi:TPA: hypothetical protein ACSEXK_004026, partial [Klebsiella pneumoniae]
TVRAAVSGVTICSDIIFSGLVITRYGPRWVEKETPRRATARPGALYSTNSGASLPRLHKAMKKNL